MKAVVAAFNQEKALVGAFSVITNLRMELFEALVNICVQDLTVKWVDEEGDPCIIQSQVELDEAIRLYEVSVARKTRNISAVISNTFSAGEQGCGVRGARVPRRAARARPPLLRRGPQHLPPRRPQVAEDVQGERAHLPGQAVQQEGLLCLLRGPDLGPGPPGLQMHQLQDVDTQEVPQTVPRPLRRLPGMYHKIQNRSIKPKDTLTPLACDVLYQRCELRIKTLIRY